MHLSKPILQPAQKYVRNTTKLVLTLETMDYKDQNGLLGRDASLLGALPKSFPLLSHYDRSSFFATWRKIAVIINSANKLRLALTFQVISIWMNDSRLERG